MFTSCSIVCSSPDSSRLTTGCPVLSWSVSSPTMKLVLSWEERVWETSGTLVQHNSLQRVAPLNQNLELELIGLIGSFWIVAQLVHLVVEHLLNPILSSSQVSRRSFGGGRSNAFYFSYRTSPVCILTTFGKKTGSVWWWMKAFDRVW